VLLAPPAELVADSRAPAARADVLAVVRPSSRADAVLAVTELPQYADLTGSPLTRLLQGDQLTRMFEELQRQMTHASEDRRNVIASSIALTSGLSIGYVVWLVRGGVLVSSMLSALPAWQMVDPMPVLAAGGAARRPRPSAGPDDPEVERLFGERAQPAGSHRVPATAPAPDARLAAPNDARRDAAALEETPR
jgi:hypothetical protein